MALKLQDLIKLSPRGNLSRDEVDFIYDTTRDLVASAQTADATKSFSPEVEELLKRTKEQLLQAIYAISGAKKIVEQLYKDKSTMPVEENERDLKAALKRVFGVEASEITFDMYKEVLVKKKEIAEAIQKEVINAQS